MTQLEQMKDNIGNEVFLGDLLIELSGVWGNGTTYGKEYIYHLVIWEMPYNDVFDGSGHKYIADGTKQLFKWVSLSNSIKIDPKTVPDGFICSVKRGMSDIWCKIDNGTILELIDNSDWLKRRKQ